jgi:hypothetical protein
MPDLESHGDDPVSPLGDRQPLADVAAQLRRAIAAGTVPPKAAAELAALLDKLPGHPALPAKTTEEDDTQATGE